jgi:hypothetical protein
VEYAAGVLHGAFHFVEHDAFEHQAAAAIALQTMALLQEVVGAQPREEHGVEIHLRQT